MGGFGVVVFFFFFFRGGGGGGGGLLFCPLREIRVIMALQPREQRYPFLSVCAVFSLCPDTCMAAIVWDF